MALLLILCLLIGITWYWRAADPPFPTRVVLVVLAGALLVGALPAQLGAIRARYALAQLVAVPDLDRVRRASGTAEGQLFIIHTSLSPDQIIAFYRLPDNHRGWEMAGEPGFRRLSLARHGERLEIRADDPSWDGTRGTLGLTRATVRLVRE